MKHNPYRCVILICGVLAYSTSFLTRWSYTGLARSHAVCCFPCHGHWGSLLDISSIVSRRNLPFTWAIFSICVSPCIEKKCRIHLSRYPVLWYLGGYFAAGVIALRLVPGWLTIYASELYHVEWGLLQTEAVIAGGVIGAGYTVGLVCGSPVLGKLSDVFVGRGGGSRFFLPR